MAIRPITVYPDQVDGSDGNFPHGKAQNVGVSGDGTGTPLEAAWLNDLWGFLQALLADGSITPSGNPDQVGASQYLEAIKAPVTALAARVTALETFAQVGVAGTAVETDGLFSLDFQINSSGFSIVSDAVQVPTAGHYEVQLSLSVSSDVTGPSSVAVDVKVATTLLLHGGGEYTTEGTLVDLRGVGIVNITNPATQRISIVNATANPTDADVVFAARRRLIIRRLK